MTIQVCVAIPPKTIDEAIELIRKADEKHADLIEIRLDSLQNHDHIADIPPCTTTPLIATNKPVEFGGKYTGNETEHQKILIDAAKNGFDYVDIDLGTPKQTELIGKLRELGAKTIVSFHDFEKTPPISKLERILEQEIDLGADVCKIITTAKTVNDNLTALNLVSEACKKVKIVCFAMGELGKHSRLVSPVFGAFFTFASLDEKRKTAKGQLTIQVMNSAYEALGLK